MHWILNYEESNMLEKILTVHNVTTQLNTAKGPIKAIQNISFPVYKGKTLGIVGESGCGKSLTALSIMRLISEPVGKIVDGHIWLDGVDILQLSPRAMQSIRGNTISMIFQEPMTSLNPVLTVGYQVEEAISLHQSLSKRALKDYTIELFNLVGIPAPEKRVNEYPHQLSGGMRQRIMIAMALSSKPAVLIADEPTTALDVTIQAQILDLLARLQAEFNMGIILITHDLGVVAEVCHEVAVMYGGKIIEYASVQEVFHHPQHPYTQGLLEALPSLDVTHQQRHLKTIKGMVPALSELPAGCSFQDRCHAVQADCRGPLGPPPLEEKRPAHHAACFHPLNT